MLDTQMTKDILAAIGDGQYVGTYNTEVMQQFIGDGDDVSENEREKFIYHMDELFDAGLYTSKGLDTEFRWGISRGIDNHISIAEVRLVLTPLGGEVLEELSKPEGLERLKAAIRSAGAVAGAEALKYGIAKLFS